jgi:hypothetical protein
MKKREKNTEITANAAPCSFSVCGARGYMVSVFVGLRLSLLRGEI